jgi:hypothetical protein
MDEAYICSEVSEGNDIEVVQFDFRESDLFADERPEEREVIKYSVLDVRELVIPDVESVTIERRVERAGSDDPTRHVLMYFD